MKNYEKPVVMVNEVLAEGVYAASGDCWSVSCDSVQESNGTHHIFQVHVDHSDTVQHISSACTIELTFSAPLSDAYAEFTSSFSGSTITITRETHANAYEEGDEVTFKVWVKGIDEATTKALTCTGKKVYCTKTANVQGGGADGN